MGAYFSRERRRDPSADRLTSVQRRRVLKLAAAELSLIQGPARAETESNDVTLNAVTPCALQARSSSRSGSQLVDALIAGLPNGVGAHSLLEDRGECRAAWRDVDRALEPIYEAVFSAVSRGEAIDAAGIVNSIPMSDAARSFAVMGIERAIDAAEAKAKILGGVLIISRCAAAAACGRLAWARWDAEVPDDLTPEAMTMDVGIVARHLARRAGEIVGVDLTAEEAAWATVEGLRLSGFPVSRQSWRPALERAQAGILDREEELAAAARHNARTSKVLSAVFGQPNAD